MSNTALLINNVSKKYALTMKNALKYGLRDAITETLNIRKSNELRCDEFWSLRNVTFSLDKGECLAILGGNGAGKSTLLKIISGIIAPDSGSVEAHGRMEKIIELSSGIKPSLTGRENIKLKATLLGLSKHQSTSSFDEIIEFSELEKFIDTPVQFYSSGMKARLGFSLAVAMSPDILLIDEILAVGDLSFRMKCYEKIDEMRANSAVILVTHAMNHVSRMADKTLVLNKGQVKHYGSVNEGIEVYHKLINAPIKKRKTHQFNPEKIKVLVKKGGQLLDTDDSVKNIVYSEELTIEGNVLVENAVSLSIKLQERNGQTITDWNSKRSKIFFSSEESFFISLGNLEYAPGIYDFIISGTDKNGKQLFLSHFLSIKLAGQHLSSIRHQPAATWESVN